MHLAVSRRRYFSGATSTSIRRSYGGALYVSEVRPRLSPVNIVRHQDSVLRSRSQGQFLSPVRGGNQ